MKLSATRLEATHYDGRFPITHPASLVFSGNEVFLTSEDVDLIYAFDKLRVSPRTGHADRFIALPDGGQYQCADDPVLDRLPQEVKSEGLVAWLEDRVSVAVVSVAIIICTLFFGYFYGLPAAAERIAQRIPIETEVSLGKHVLQWFDDKQWFTASQIDQGLQDSIKKKFNRLHLGLLMSNYINLKFRNSKPMGPNAFALPGGTIVITDQMIAMADSEEEVLAILAHEIGHAERRHSMRQILQSSFVALAAATITADAASLSAAVAGLPVIVARTKYSRDFETEADEFAFDLLKRHHIPTEAFASIMERLDKERKAGRKLAFISTHPITRERIKRAREASKLTP